MDKNSPEKPDLEKIAEKLFNEEEYHTAYIGAEGLQDKPGNREEHPLEQLLELLGSHNSEHKDAGLELLKNEKNAAFLREAIMQCQNKNHLAILLAACWESGIDLSGQELFFADYMMDTDLFVSLEAITILDTMDLTDIVVIEAILEKLKDPKLEKHPNEAMLSDLKQRLEEKVQENH